MDRHRSAKLMIAALLWLGVFSLGGLSLARAQGSSDVTLTITPPLVKVGMNPGESWSSTLKLVNNGDRPLTIFTSKMDFTSGPDGGVKLLDPQRDRLELEGIERFRLSEWLELPSDPIVIAPQGSQEIVYTIKVPADAEPGGHYAAILAGTKPTAEGSGSLVKISSLLASLVMLNVAGETDERGAIAEFSTGRLVFDRPPVDFTVRFANQGNIHLQPQGEIFIRDMYGREKGRLPINHATEFGNVLPGSTRKWTFVWQRDLALWEMGRYKASLILGFGTDERRNIFEERYFWVVNYKLAGGFLLGLIGSIWGLSLLIRFYVRRAVREAQSAAGMITPPVSSVTLNKISVIPQSGSPNEDDLEIRHTTVKAVEGEAGTRARWLVLSLLLAGIIGAVFFLWYFARPMPEEQTRRGVFGSERIG